MDKEIIWFNTKKYIYSHYFLEFQLLGIDSICQKFMTSEFWRICKVIRIVYSDANHAILRHKTKKEK